MIGGIVRTWAPLASARARHHARPRAPGQPNQAVRPPSPSRPASPCRTLGNRRATTGEFVTGMYLGAIFCSDVKSKWHCYS